MIQIGDHGKDWKASSTGVTPPSPNEPEIRTKVDAEYKVLGNRLLAVQLVNGSQGCSW